jgi:AraC-like DNA-binding protein
MLIENSPQVFYEAMLNRAGLRPCGGNFTRFPTPEPTDNGIGCAAWANDFIGLFVMDNINSDVVELDTLVLRDVIAFGVVLNEAPTSLVVGERSFTAEGSEMSLIFLPRGERFRFSTRSARGLKSVTIVADLMSLAEAYGIAATDLPASLVKMIAGQQTTIDKLVPTSLINRIVDDIASRRGMYPSLPSFYFEGKARELVSALMLQVTRRDDDRTGGDAVDPRMLENLETVKRTIDRNPSLSLDIDRYSRLAGVNRTKLRAAFRQTYGTTLSDYRTAIVMQRADKFLRETGTTVQLAASRAGYATTSSFIVAYKRHFGFSPGQVRRD